MTTKKSDVLLAEKDFYELKINTLNERIERIKQRCSDLEKENVEIKKQYKNLEEESSDITAYLKRSISQKHEEIKIVTEKLQALQSTKATEKDKYQEQIQALEKDYKRMHDTFTAEVKLLSGQLSSLESFKNNREAMVKKLISLEEELRKKDEHHALALRNNENKYILMKEKLSAYVEEKLLKLSLNLQKQTQYTVSEATHNVVKENIAINNELNLIIGSWQKIFDDNELLKERTNNLEHELEIAKEMKDTALKKNYILNQIIDRLRSDQETLRSRFSSFEQSNAEMQETLEQYKEQVEQCTWKALRAEGMYKEVLELQERLKIENQQIKSHNYKLEKIIKKAVTKIQEVIGLQENKTTKTITNEEEFTLRRQLLNALLELFDTFNLFENDKPPDDEVSESEDNCDWTQASTVLQASPLLKLTLNTPTK